MHLHFHLILYRVTESVKLLESGTMGVSWKRGERVNGTDLLEGKRETEKNEMVGRSDSSDTGVGKQQLWPRLLGRVPLFMAHGDVCQ
jgi:hypothetical protein